MADDLEKKPIRKTLVGMNVGESTTFPARQYSSVQSSSANYGFESGRRYSLKRDRERKILIVTRVE